MLYNNISISPSGFVNVSHQGPNSVTGSLGFQMSSEWAISWEEVTEKVTEAGYSYRLKIMGPVGIVIAIVVFKDKADMLLAYDDLIEFTSDRVNELLENHFRKPSLRSVEMIVLNEKCRPISGSQNSAGYDCFIDTDTLLTADPDVKYFSGLNILTLEPGECKLFSLGFKLMIGDKNFAARLVPRSGKGHRGLVLGNLTGTIDADYEGVWHASLWNRTAFVLEIDLNDPVCQVIFERVEHPRFIEVEKFSEMNRTNRRDGGFGSSDERRAKEAK